MGIERNVGRQTTGSADDVSHAMVGFTPLSHALVIDRCPYQRVNTGPLRSI